MTDGHRASTRSGFLPDTTYAVLGLLSFGSELSGYELRQLARNSLRFFYWSPAQSQIYRELRRLAGLGYVTGRKVSQASRPDKVAYSITQAGRAELGRWLETAPVAPPAIRYDAALRLFFGHVTSPQRLREIVAQHQRHLEGLLDQLREVRAMLGSDPSLALPRIIADWGEHLYTHEAEAVSQVDAALSELTLPAGPVTVPPGTITPPADHRPDRPAPDRPAPDRPAPDRPAPDRPAPELAPGRTRPDDQ
jgi:DNA-binding PadR family transcriptional regulator